MHYVGAHVSAEGGVQNAPLNAKAIGARAFALFTKNQRQWRAKPLESASIDAFRKNCADNGFEPGQILAHDGYLINLGNPGTAGRKQSWDAFLVEMQRCQDLGIPLLNMHPGSHLRQYPEDACLAVIADGINRALEKTTGVTVVVENTAGQGSNVGYRFEQLALVIDKVEDRSRVGFCLDTCHLFTAGYDIRDAAALDETLVAADRIIGLKFLRGMHLNDSKCEFGTRRDRHESIGKGFIGAGCFKAIMNEPRLAGIPLILETPDETKWAGEIKSLYAYQKKPPTPA